MCVDHHLLKDVDAEFSILDVNAASTGEVIYRLIEHAGPEVTREIAECIYTTLVVDTGFFKYSNTNDKVLALASKLVEAGASPWLVAKNLDESHPVSRIKLLSLSLVSFEIQCDGKYSSMDVTSDMLEKSGATIDVSEEFATYPRSIDTVEVSALFRDIDDEMIKVSLRSKDYVDVSKIAGGFGGGGHARAAGFRIRCSLAEAKEKLLKVVKQNLK